MGIRIICKNKKAYHDYFIEDKFEAGIVLTGSEVKSLRAGKAQIRDSYARIINGELFLVNTHITPYGSADSFNHIDPERSRKLLVHRHEIERIYGKTREKGYALVPIMLYFKRGKAKVEIAIAKGKKSYDKRESLKRKAVMREMEQEMKWRK